MSRVLAIDEQLIRGFSALARYPAVLLLQLVRC